jgi:sec-independent protein translocase protein TatA
MLGLSNLILGITNASDIIVIIIIAVVVMFGAKKIPDIARSLGKASTEYQKSKIEAKKEIELIRSGNDNSDNNLNRAKLEEIADKLGIDCSARSDEELRNAIETEIRKQK